MAEPEKKSEPGQGGGQPPEGGLGGGQPGEGKGEPQTYKLPDGREVTGEEVLEEYNKLLPEFTKKSQLLSELEKKFAPRQDDPWSDPNYRPQTWGEVLAEAEKRALARIEARDKERQDLSVKEQQDRDALNRQIDASVDKIKLTDKELDSDDMFAFAAEKAKKGVQYQTVEGLYEDYKAIREARKQGQIDAQKNIQRRQGGDVGVGRGGPATPGGPVSLESIRTHKSIIDLARDRLSRANK